MKFLKTQNTSRFGLKDNSFKVNPYGRYIMDGVGGLRLPKGTTAQQPDLSGVEMPNGPNGMLRYNISTDELECYIAGAWETVKGSASNSITKQTIGPGDLVETIFGPLNTTYAPDYTASADNIIVLVENVMQISSTNFTIVNNPAGLSSATGYLAGIAYPPGYYLSFGDAVPIGKNVTIYYGYAN
jgi:hypothetical protein